MANTGPGPSNPGANTDASTNAMPIEEVDPKQPWSPLGQALSAPPGFYPLGIEAQSDREIEDFVPDSMDTVPPRSVLPPRMGARLSDQPPSARGFGIMSGR